MDFTDCINYWKWEIFCARRKAHHCRYCRKPGSSSWRDYIRFCVAKIRFYQNYKP